MWIAIPYPTPRWPPVPHASLCLTIRDTFLPFCLLNVYDILSSGVKPPGREADHTPTCSTEVKNELSYTSTSTTPSWHVKRQLYWVTWQNILYPPIFLVSESCLQIFGFSLWIGVQPVRRQPSAHTKTRTHLHKTESYVHVPSRIRTHSAIGGRPRWRAIDLCLNLYVRLCKTLYTGKWRWRSHRKVSSE